MKLNPNDLEQAVRVGACFARIDGAWAPRCSRAHGHVGDHDPESSELAPRASALSDAGESAA